MNQQEKVLSNYRMKRWASSSGISYRQLATVLNQSAASISKKINGITAWQERDLVLLHDHFGLSADFVLGLVPMSESDLLGVS